MSNVNITIDGVEMSVPSTYTILDAAREHNIDIPTLCHLKDINEIGACRMCIVEVEGARGFVTSCVYPVSDGMVVRTNTKQVREARKATLELLLSTHKKNCLSCSRNTDCELQALAEQMGVGEVIYDDEEEKEKLIPMAETDFFNYIYSSGADTDWSGTTNYDGCTFLSTQPAIQ